mmetsp:Transcript_31040/g.36419  ORF Transcript_31040/g.36419 Transcript_31040/m.36419 type:complete len:97 (-) Transcript_31040:28-318(-)
MKPDFRKFKPLKYRDAIENSDSLNYDANGDKIGQLKREKVNFDREIIIKNIRDYLLKTGAKMNGVSVEMIDAVERFENINLFTRTEKPRAESIHGK